MSLPRVLVADDKGYVREFLATVLCLRGYEVEMAASGREVLERAKEKRPALILLDLLMPEMDGQEVVLALQRDPDLRDIPVVMMTARVEAKDEPLPPGVREILVKPFGLEALYAAVERLAPLPLRVAEAP